MSINLLLKLLKEFIQQTVFECLVYYMSDTGLHSGFIMVRAKHPPNPAPTNGFISSWSCILLEDPEVNQRLHEYTFNVSVVSATKMRYMSVRPCVRRHLGSWVREKSFL